MLLDQLLLVIFLFEACKSAHALSSLQNIKSIDNLIKHRMFTRKDIPLLHPSQWLPADDIPETNSLHLSALNDLDIKDKRIDTNIRKSLKKYLLSLNSVAA